MIWEIRYLTQKGGHTMYFEQAGGANTEKCLQIAKDEALKRGIKYLVVASTSGSTGLQAAQMLQDTDIKLVVVAHSAGLTEPGKQLLEEGAKKEIENLGGVVFIGTDTLTGFQIAMKNRGGILRGDTDFKCFADVWARNEGLCGNRGHGYRCESSTRYGCNCRCRDRAWGRHGHRYRCQLHQSLL